MPPIKATTEFLEYLEIEKGRTLSTIKIYQAYLKHFFKVMQIVDITDISKETIRSYRLHLNRSLNNRKNSDSRTLDAKTQNYYLIALRSFLKYWVRQGLPVLSPDSIELISTADTEIQVLSKDELSKLIHFPHPTTVSGLRNNAIIQTLYSTGLRVSELVALNRDIDLTKDEVTVRGKGRKIRLVFLSPTAKESIQKYLDKRTDIDEAGLFLLHSNQAKKLVRQGKSLRLSRKAIWEMITKTGVMAGISTKITPHGLRHSFATELLRNGADIRSVQMILGHANISTTQQYTHLADQHLKEVHQKYHGSSKSV